MWRSKKVIVGAVLAAVLLFGSLGGVALADNGDGGLKAKLGDFITSVCDIYDENVEPDIDREALQAAIDEVRTQMAEDRAEMQAAAIKDHLAKMVENGVIDETQAQELQEWLESKPDVPVRFDFRGDGGFRGSGMGRLPPCP